MANWTKWQLASWSNGHLAGWQVGTFGEVSNIKECNAKDRTKLFCAVVYCTYCTNCFVEFVVLGEIMSLFVCGNLMFWGCLQKVKREVMCG